MQVQGLILPWDDRAELSLARQDFASVPFATQNRLLARLAPLHRDIVNVR